MWHASKSLLSIDTSWKIDSRLSYLLLLIRALNVVVVAGYLNNAEATASTLDSEGWLKTGDLCHIDEDGFIFVVDRLKELIKYKGYQARH